MKKLALVLALIMVVSCFSVFVSAETDPECDLRPIEADGGNAKVEIDGATVETDSNGTARITLTNTVATVKIIFKDNGGTYEELLTDIKNEQKYVRYFIALGDGIDKVEIHGHYARGDKPDGSADLYLSGMQANPGYFVHGDATTNYGVWDISKYLGDRAGKGYVPEDGNIQFYDNEFRIEGTIGSVLTVYY